MKQTELVTETIVGGEGRQEELERPGVQRAGGPERWKLRWLSWSISESSKEKTGDDRVPLYNREGRVSTSATGRQSSNFAQSKYTS
jgi:hypothetical protein